MLCRTSFAVSTDETRYVLNGIFVSLKEHKLTFVSTDGRRLALTEEEVELAPGHEAEFIIPTKAINELNRLLQANGEVEIKYTENQASFKLNVEKRASVILSTKQVVHIYLI